MGSILLIANKVFIPVFRFFYQFFADSVFWVKEGGFNHYLTFLNRFIPVANHFAIV